MFKSAMMIGAIFSMSVGSAIATLKLKSNGQTMSNPLDKPGQLFLVELWAPNPTSRRGKEGPIYRVSFELAQSDWQMFMDAENNIRLYAKMAVIDDIEEKSAVEAVEGEEGKANVAAGENGKFWNRMRKLRVHCMPELRAVIGVEQSASEEEAWAALRETFQVKSMTDVTPFEFIAFCEKHGIAKKLPKEAREA